MLEVASISYFSLHDVALGEPTPTLVIYHDKMQHQIFPPTLPPTLNPFCFKVLKLGLEDFICFVIFNVPSTQKG
jgi:hypothetical protein